jgi:hypothetical protein
MGLLLLAIEDLHDVLDWRLGGFDFAGDSGIKDVFVLEL